jgi:hypothetical protein
MNGFIMKDDPADRFTKIRRGDDQFAPATAIFFRLSNIRRGKPPVAGSDALIDR